MIPAGRVFFAYMYTNLYTEENQCSGAEGRPAGRSGADPKPELGRTWSARLPHCSVVIESQGYRFCFYFMYVNMCSIYIRSLFINTIPMIRTKLNCLTTWTIIALPYCSRRVMSLTALSY